MFTKRRRSPSPPTNHKRSHAAAEDDDDIDTDTKLAMLLSLHPKTPLETLMTTLLANNGSVTKTSASLHRAPPSQTSIHSFLKPPKAGSNTASSNSSEPPKPPKKGQTLHLYTPSQIALHTPCSLLPNFFPAPLASSLLDELLLESSTFPPPGQFRLYGRLVSSPCTTGFFRKDPHSPGFAYQGSSATPRPFTASMSAATALVERAVHSHTGNTAWTTDTALVNRYVGPSQGVGWHTDTLTYIGPRAIIASVTLGCAREFRVRKHKEGDDEEATGQIAVHLPHNSLLVMHAGMQEEWKHAVPTVKKVEPHPVAGEVRINITYRWYRLAPEVAPRCKCGLGTALRALRGGGYAWMCEGGYRGTGENGEGCGFWSRYAEEEEEVVGGKDLGGVGSEGTAKLEQKTESEEESGEVKAE